MILRVTIANIEAATLAARIQAAGLNATVFQSWGAGGWGVEPGATAEFVVSDLIDPRQLGYEPEDGRFSQAHREVREFIVATLRYFREEAAYLTLDGRLAFLLYAGKTVSAGEPASAAHPFGTGRVYSWIPVKVEVL